MYAYAFIRVFFSTFFLNPRILEENVFNSVTKLFSAPLIIKFWLYYCQYVGPIYFFNSLKLGCNDGPAKKGKVLLRLEKLSSLFIHTSFSCKFYQVEFQRKFWIILGFQRPTHFFIVKKKKEKENEEEVPSLFLPNIIQILRRIKMKSTISQIRGGN